MKLLFLLATIVLGAATQSALADIKIGVILSLTGTGASLGIPAKNAIALWPKEVAGQKVNVIMIDDASDPTASAVAARRLIQEEKVDLLVGPSVTPTSLAVVQVAGEAMVPVITLAGSDSIVLPADGNRRWAFKTPPNEMLPMQLIFDTMKANKQHRLGIAAVSTAYGQAFVDVAKKMAGPAGVEIVQVERFSATDTSFTAQAVKLTSAAPDAIFIAASGTPAALPQLEVKKRGFAGTIYQTQAVANNDFLRVGGKDVDGTLLPATPMLVAEQLPDTNPVKAVAMIFVNKFEGQYGPGTRSLFGAMAWDAMTLIEKVVPGALSQAKPGSPEFRKAVRDGIELLQNVPLTQGIYSLSPSNHNGADARSQVMVRIDNGKWKYVP
jgi:branched-chain amino acid transport system substrate-binding protein